VAKFLINSETLSHSRRTLIMFWNFQSNWIQRTPLRMTATVRRLTRTNAS